MLRRLPHGPVLELQLDRPPANALSPELIVALRRAVQTAPSEGFEGVLLSGRTGMFSAGLDVPLLVTFDRSGIEGLWEEFLGLLGALAGSPIPVGVAITGHAPAGGAVISIFCDQRTMAAGDYKIGLNEVEVGIALPAEMMLPLRRLVGAGQAERLAVAGLMVGPDEALRLGLVDEVVPADAVVERALERLRHLLARPRHAMLATRRLFRSELISALGGGTIRRQLVEQWFSEETQEALRALVERLRARQAVGAG
ncbi:MAG: enoyl-CoA hydratase/isomerase family protein [Thermoanaerobaculia bacterium]